MSKHTKWAEITDCAGLVQRLRAFNPAGEEELYHYMRRRYLYVHKADFPKRDDSEDLLHDAFIATLAAIRRIDEASSLRDESLLSGFINTIARRVMWMSLFEDMRRDSARYVEIDALTSERLETLTRGKRFFAGSAKPDGAAMHEVQKERNFEVLDRKLVEMRPKDREVLDRFYFRDQSREQIEKEMGLTETQFRLLKSRAKAKLAYSVQDDPQFMKMAA